jgi:hypothetical protein
MTFGQVFTQGQLLTTESLVGVLSNGTQVPLQVNVKATHADGSVRHAVISAVIPQLLAGQTLAMNLVKTAAKTNPSGDLAALISSGFSTNVTIVTGGVTYTASANQALQNGSAKVWLNGAIVNEWTMMVPLKDASGNAHPHLTARFAVRSYAGMKKAKVDVVIDNDWAYQPSPQNFTYDVQVAVGGQTVYSKTGLNHYHHARWKKSFWWGGAPQADVKLNGRYIINTKAVPNYDPTVTISESHLASLQAGFSGANAEPMGAGVAMAGMPTTGGRPDIGLNPGWAVAYLLTMDKRAKDATLGTGDMSGSWSMHFRDQKTDRPLSIKDYPYSTLLGNPGDTVNPATGKSEAFPACGGDCSTPFQADSAHEPNMDYIAYLTTGDFYYLEELQFYAMFNLFQHNPYYRQFDKGIVSPDQERGQAWSLRTLADAAYITPDSDSMKSQFATLLNNNLDWYNTNYSNNSSANALGIITHGYSVVYDNSTGTAPWQDDFFTQAIGHVVELGFTKAQPLLAYKSKFVLGRMMDPGFCWILAANYSLKVRDTSTSPIYSNFADVYQKSIAPDVTSLTCGSAEMAAKLGVKVGEMPGYSYSNSGYPSNMQPALAYASTSGAANGPTAWQKFMNRSVLPDYQNGAQFAIVPRK